MPASKECAETGGCLRATSGRGNARTCAGSGPADNGSADLSTQLGPAGRVRKSIRAAAPPGAQLVVAIDGPAGAGKTTVARATARALGLRHIDTGAMYRALTWLALQRGIDPDDGRALGALARRALIRYGSSGVEIAGEALGRRIRSPAVNRAVSQVSAHPGVRRELVRRQRTLLRGGAVLEGRDIGTVVAPRAPVKVFLTASPAERARRRYREMTAQGERVAPRALAREIANRDRLDSRRAASPLRPAADAVVIDSTGKSPRQVVAEILALVDAAGRTRRRR